MKRNSRMGYWRIRSVASAVVACGLLVSGCVQSRPAPTPPPDNSAQNRSADIEHRVTYSGETLALIAAWYTGRGSNWTIIREANPKLRPERINIGQTIIVPGGIIVERRPMPKKFITDSLAKVRPSTTNTAATTTNTTPPPSDQPVSTEDILTPPPSDPGKVDARVDTPPKVEQPADEINLDAILNEQIEAQKKAKDTAAVPPPAKDPAPPVDTTAAPKNDKAPAAPGDSEREQLLDELLTQ